MKSITINIPDESYYYIKNTAKENHLTVPGEVIRVLKEYYDRDIDNGPAPRHPKLVMTGGYYETDGTIRTAYDNFPPADYNMKIKRD